MKIAGILFLVARGGNPGSAFVGEWEFRGQSSGMTGKASVLVFLEITHLKTMENGGTYERRI